VRRALDDARTAEALTPFRRWFEHRVSASIAGMPLPDDIALDATINELYDAVQKSLHNKPENIFAVFHAQSASLQAASQRRLVVAIEKATQAQERTAAAQEQTNKRMVRLEVVGIALAIVGVCLAAVQIWFGGGQIWVSTSSWI
jgi:hypothetical protein